MKSKLLIATITCACLTACTKDEFTTKPQLTFISVNQTEFVQGDLIEFNLEYTDKEGDILITSLASSRSMGGRSASGTTPVISALL